MLGAEQRKRRSTVAGREKGWGATEVAWRKREKMPKGKGEQKGEPRKLGMLFFLRGLTK